MRHPVDLITTLAGLASAALLGHSSGYPGSQGRNMRRSDVPADETTPYPNRLYYGAPTEEQILRIEERRQARHRAHDARKKAKALREQTLNPQYSSEPMRSDFPSRQAHRRAVKIWNRQSPSQHSNTP